MKKLLLENKFGLTKYMLGILITTPSNIIMSYGMARIFELPKSESFVKEALFIFVIMTIPILIQIVSRLLRIGFMNDILYEVRIRAYKGIISQDIGSFKEKEPSYYQSKLVSDVKVFEEDFFLSLLRMGFSLGSYLVGIIFVWTVSKEIAGFIIIGTALLYGLSRYFSRETVRRKQRVLHENMMYNQGIKNLIYGLVSIQAYGAEKMFNRLFSQDIKNLEKTKESSNAYDFYQKDIMLMCSSVFQFMSFIYAAWLLSQGKISVTVVILILNILGQLMWSVTDALSFINKFKSSLVIYDSLTAQPEPKNLPGEIKPNADYVLNGVRYKYNETIVLDDVSLNFKAKHKYLIIGPSGSGKSTLLNILAGHVDDYEGSIEISGVELDNVSYQSRFQNIAYVTQNHFFFDESIRDNIVLDNPYDAEKYESVLRDAALVDWIKTLDNGSDTMLIENASNISGGQKQRIHIARELYQDKQIIILDEMTASLDEVNAFKIYDTLVSLDKTVICTSHRHQHELANRFDEVIDLGGFVYEKA